MTARHSMPDEGEYRLAKKLHREYAERGASLRGICATSTEELMMRAKMGSDPNENVSQEAFAERLRARADRRNDMHRPGNGNSVHTHARPDPLRVSSESTVTPPKRKAVGEKKTTEKPKEFSPVQKQRMPVSFFIMLAMMSAMVLMIILRIADVYQTADRISALENRLDTLKSTAEEMELKLDEKNDIRTIEQIATTRLGMVKEDSVQRKYISLSDGERIDLVEDDTQESEGFGTMLSSLLSVLSNLFHSAS